MNTEVDYVKASKFAKRKCRTCLGRGYLVIQTGKTFLKYLKRENKMVTSTLPIMRGSEVTKEVYCGCTKL